MGIILRIVLFVTQLERYPMARDDDRPGNDRDLVLVPGEFAYILDRTKGQVSMIVGPYKISMSATDAPVKWDGATRRFVDCGMNESRQPYPNAPEGHYLVLTNPSLDQKQPQKGTSSPMADLHVGRTINIPGPANFPLWPGQVASVVPGHRLRSNEYLVVRVYNDEEAEKNWAHAVMKPQAPQATKPTSDDGGVSGEGKVGVQPPAETPSTPPDASASMPKTLTMGQLIIIKGTEVSFYMPPTGIEVVKDENGDYVRKAVTLERLEYCILLGENGEKRYLKGPAVVFPEPTEKFVEKKGENKFEAIELNPGSGIYIKVIADYADEDTKVEHKAGEELFLTGGAQAIYYPRPEHALIKYGDKEIHYAVVVPEGEGRYVLNKDSGKVSLKHGPQMLLPDPRKEVIVRRVLSDAEVSLWFPGNSEALEVNRDLSQKADGGKNFLYSEEAARGAQTLRSTARAAFAGDAMSRSTAYTPPRTITLNTKYEGAVTIDVYNGYAILLVNKTGKRRVVVGPQTVLLEYDERLVAFELSTGKPKTTDKLLKTVYLKVRSNTVSDIVQAETADLVNVSVKLSYRVNFEGEDHERWFSVENYVKFLTDHLRSRLRAAVKRIGVEDFNRHAVDIVRDTILGEHPEEGTRAGRSFEENGMRVYDIEVLAVTIGDAAIAELLKGAQRDSVEEALELAAAERTLDATRRREEITRKTNQLQAETRTAAKELKMKALEEKVDLDEKEGSANKAAEKFVAEVAALVRERMKADADQRLAIATGEQNSKIEFLNAEAEAIAKRFNAMSPDMAAALSAFANREVAEKLAVAMAPLALASGTSVSETLGQLFKGTQMENLFKTLAAPAPIPVAIAAASR